MSSNVKRGYIKEADRVSVAVGTWVDGFAGWHRIVSLNPMLTMCGMGFVGVLPDVARASLSDQEYACSECRDLERLWMNVEELRRKGT